MLVYCQVKWKKEVKATPLQNTHYLSSQVLMDFGLSLCSEHSLGRWQVGGWKLAVAAVWQLRWLWVGLVSSLKVGRRQSRSARCTWRDGKSKMKYKSRGGDGDGDCDCDRTPDCNRLQPTATLPVFLSRRLNIVFASFRVGTRPRVNARLPSSPLYFRCQGFSVQTFPNTGDQFPTLCFGGTNTGDRNRRPENRLDSS